MPTLSCAEISSAENWFKPCLKIDCMLEFDYGECILDVCGFLLSEEEKIVSELIPVFNKNTVYCLMARDNREYNAKKERSEKQKVELSLFAPLDYFTLKYLEEVREKNPKRDMVLKVLLHINYIESNIVNTHLHEIPVSSLGELGKVIEEIKIGLEPPESLVVYKYSRDFHPRRGNMWILSGDGSPKVAYFKVTEIEHEYRIPYSDWVNDYLPKLLKYRATLIEVPVIEKTPLHDHLKKAVEELELAYRNYYQGRYSEVIFGLRNIIMNHLLTKIVEKEVKRGEKVEIVKERYLSDEIKEILLSNVPQESIEDYKTVIKSIEKNLKNILQNHLSKFVHIDSGKLLKMPLREDAEYLLLAITSVLKYFTELSSKIS